MKIAIQSLRGLILSALVVIPVLANGDSGLVSEVAALQARVSELETQQTELIAKIDSLTKRLESLTRSRARQIDLKNVPISSADDPRRGDPAATIVVVEFSDYQCPYCRRHTMNTLPKLKEEYIDSGKIQYVFKDFPLERIHKEAVVAAVAANCAGQQNQYWEMHDELFANPKNIEPVSQHAEKLGLDIAAFSECVADESQVAEVRSDLQEARKLGVRSTPTFILGKANPDGSISGQRLVRGAVAFQKFKEEIDALEKKLSTNP